MIYVKYMTLQLLSINMVNFKRINCENTNLLIIGSNHENKKMMSNKEKCEKESKTIEKQLFSHNPSVIFIELPKEKDISFVNTHANKSPKHYGTETVAVANYMSSNSNVKLIPVDSGKLRALNTYDASEHMKQMSRLTRNNSLAYNTLGYLTKENIDKAAMVIGVNHMSEVIKILSQ